MVYIFLKIDIYIKIYVIISKETLIMLLNYI